MTLKNYLVNLFPPYFTNKETENQSRVAISPSIYKNMYIMNDAISVQSEMMIYLN